MPLTPLVRPASTLLEKNSAINHARIIAYCDAQNPGHNEAKQGFTHHTYFKQLEAVLEELPMKLLSQPEADVFVQEYCPLMLDWIQRLIELKQIQQPYIKETRLPKRDGGGIVSGNLTKLVIGKLKNLIVDSIVLHKEALEDIFYEGNKSCSEWLSEQISKISSTLKR